MLVNLIKNSFGNYVIQKAMNLAEGETTQIICDAVYDCIPQIADKKIKMKWA